MRQVDGPELQSHGAIDRSAITIDKVSGDDPNNFPIERAKGQRVLLPTRGST